MHDPLHRSPSPPLLPKPAAARRSRWPIDARALPLGARRAIFAVAAAFCFTPRASDRPDAWRDPGAHARKSVRPPQQASIRQAAPGLRRPARLRHGFARGPEGGANGALFAAATITATLGLGWGLGRWLGIGNKTSALISVGTAICGGSAIAAVGSVVGVAEGEITVAMGTVFILNAVALYLFPPLGHALHLSQGQFGT